MFELTNFAYADDGTIAFTVPKNSEPIFPGQYIFEQLFDSMDRVGKILKVIERSTYYEVSAEIINLETRQKILNGCLTCVIQLDAPTYIYITHEICVHNREVTLNRFLPPSPIANGRGHMTFPYSSPLTSTGIDFGLRQTAREMSYRAAREVNEVIEKAFGFDEFNAFDEFHDLLGAPNTRTQRYIPPQPKIEHVSIDSGPRKVRLED